MTLRTECQSQAAFSKDHEDVRGRVEDGEEQSEPDEVAESQGVMKCERI